MANLCSECEHNYVHNRNGVQDYICSPCRDKEDGREYPKVVDILGNELELGDHVVWPTVVGRSAEIAHGTILEIRYSTGTDARWYPIKVKIQPAADSRWHGRWNRDDELPKPVTLSKSENVVRVPMP
jgi:uncharacterized Zn ribbon protein